MLIIKILLLLRMSAYAYAYALVKTNLYGSWENKTLCFPLVYTRTSQLKNRKQYAKKISAGTQFAMASRSTT